MEPTDNNHPTDGQTAPQSPVIADELSEDDLRNVEQFLPDYGTFKSARSIATDTNSELEYVRFVLSVLVSANRAISRRGRSGGFSKPPVVVPVESASVDFNTSRDEAASQQRREADYYSEIADQIKLWLKDNGSIEAVAITAHQGAAQTGGKWSRPDIYAVVKRQFLYYHSSVFDYLSFEVKLYRDLAVNAVYEALNHRKQATKSYLVVIKADDKENQEVETIIADTCAAHGIGLFYVKANDMRFEQWDWKFDASRYEAEPIDIDNFLSIQFFNNDRFAELTKFR
jgi:hypothetical protein